MTMIDPNIRPGFIAGKEAEYRARIERMVARADIVKLSDEDLHWLEGAGDLVALARGILAKGPKVVFITEGAAGARAVTASQDRFVAATKVDGRRYRRRGRYVQRGGSGGFASGGGAEQGAAWQRFRMRNWTRPCRLGTRAAAVTVSRAGREPALGARTCEGAAAAGFAGLGFGGRALWWARSARGC